MNFFRAAIAASSILCLAALAWLCADPLRSRPAYALTPPPPPAPVVAAAVDADVNIDCTDLHQVIDGFGAAQPQYYFANSSVQDHAFTDMGVSLLRLELQFDLEPINDNGDPATVNLPGFDATSQAGIIGVAQGAQTRGVQTFVGTPWSPPAWMKTNSNVIGGALTAGMEPELAEYFSTYVERMQTIYGVPITHLSLQNEPNVTPGWWGCQYTPAQMATLVKETGARLTLDSRATEIVVADTSSLSSAPAFLNGIMSDALAAPYVKVLSTHPYDISWTNPDSAVAAWNTLRGIAQTYGVKLWQTEHSNWNDFSATAGNWTSAMLMSQHLHVALTQGDVSAWFYWNLNRQNQTASDGYGQSLYVDQLPIAKAYAMGQFAKHVRPGAQRVGATSTDSNVLVSAYRDNTAGKVILVCINRAGTTKTVGLAVTGQPLDAASQAWRSSVGESHVTVTGVDLSTGTATVTLPADSITTYVCDMYTAKTVTLTAPNGGERLAAGSTVTVTWSSTGAVAGVDILISYAGGGNYLTVAGGIANTGSYSFALPPFLLNNVKIKVQETGNPAVSDASNSPFSIVLPTGKKKGCAVGSTANFTASDCFLYLLLLLSLGVRRHAPLPPAG